MLVKLIIQYSKKECCIFHKLSQSLCRFLRGVHILSNRQKGVSKRLCSITGKGVWTDNKIFVFLTNPHLFWVNLVADLTILRKLRFQGLRGAGGSTYGRSWKLIYSFF